MSVFGMNVKAQVLEEGLNRLGKLKVELVLVSAMILLAWIDSSQAGESFNFIIDQFLGSGLFLISSQGYPTLLILGGSFLKLPKYGISIYIVIIYSCYYFWEFNFEFIVLMT